VRDIATGGRGNGKNSAQGRGGGRGGRGNKPSKYSKEEKEQMDKWRAEGRCFNCGEPDHQVRNCKVVGLVIKELKELE
jgi:hypothetical protein